MTKTMGKMAEEMKMIQPLNLMQKLLNQILVIGDIAAVGGHANTKVAFKNCAPFTRCATHMNDEHVEVVANLDIIMPMHNLHEYSDNYADSSGSFWQFKRDEQNMINGGNPDNVVTANPSSFKYKSSLLEGLNSRDVAANINPHIANAHRLFTNTKIVVLLNYLSNCFRSLEMPLINCKIHLELNWAKNCVISGIAGATTFQITSTKFYVSIATLSTKNNVSLRKQLNEGFERSVYWNEYKSKIEIKEANNQNLTRFSLDASFQGVNTLFVFGFNNAGGDADQVERNNHRKYFLLRVDITKYNVLIDGRNFYDQPISGRIKKYDPIKKIATDKEMTTQQDVC